MIEAKASGKVRNLNAFSHTRSPAVFDFLLNFSYFTRMSDYPLLYASESAKAFYIEPDILYLSISAQTPFTEQESRAITQKAFDHFKGKYKVLTFPEEHSIIESEVRDYLVSTRRQERVVADAVIVTNLPHRLLADFYLKVQRPSIPTKFFKGFDEALEWLRSLE